MGGTAACCPVQFFEPSNCSKYAALRQKGFREKPVVIAKSFSLEHGLMVLGHRFIVRHSGARQ